jgi:DNA-binding MarR family transcriptional regulator
MDDPSPEQLVDLPPSAKLVFKTLEYADTPLTQQQLVGHSRLSSRTTRYALTRLQSVELVDKKIHLADARQSLYQLSADESTPESAPSPTEYDG